MQFTITMGFRWDAIMDCVMIAVSDGNTMVSSIDASPIVVSESMIYLIRNN